MRRWLQLLSSTALHWHLPSGHVCGSRMGPRRPAGGGRKRPRGRSVHREGAREEGPTETREPTSLWLHGCSDGKKYKREGVEGKRIFLIVVKCIEHKTDYCNRFPYTLQWHKVHSHGCEITTIHLQNVSSCQTETPTPSNTNSRSPPPAPDNHHSSVSVNLMTTGTSEYQGHTVILLA